MAKRGNRRRSFGYSLTSEGLTCDRPWSLSDPACRNCGAATIIDGSRTCVPTCWGLRTGTMSHLPDTRPWRSSTLNACTHNTTTGCIPADAAVARPKSCRRTAAFTRTHPANSIGVPPAAKQEHTADFHEPKRPVSPLYSVINPDRKPRPDAIARASARAVQGSARTRKQSTDESSSIATEADDSDALVEEYIAGRDSVVWCGDRRRRSGSRCCQCGKWAFGSLPGETCPRSHGKEVGSLLQQRYGTPTAAARTCGRHHGAGSKRAVEAHFPRRRWHLTASGRAWIFACRADGRAGRLERTQPQVSRRRGLRAVGGGPRA